MDVDLARLQVTAACGGPTVVLSPIDPEDAPPARHLAPHRSSSAKIVFEGPQCAGTTRVCVDVSAVSGGGGRQTPICFPTPGPDA